MQNSSLIYSDNFDLKNERKKNHKIEKQQKKMQLKIDMILVITKNELILIM